MGYSFCSRALGDARYGLQLLFYSSGGCEEWATASGLELWGMRGVGYSFCSIALGDARCGLQLATASVLPEGARKFCFVFIVFKPKPLNPKP